MPFYGMNQDLVNDRIMHIAGTRVLTADKDAALPSPQRITKGAEPSGYVDHGAIVSANVELNFDMPKEAINRGRIPTPARYYLGSQSGFARFQMQEYQPEQIDLAAGGDGTPESATGFKRSYIGGELPPEKRLLLLDDFDIDSAVNTAEPWKQFWWTSPRVQGGGTFQRAENERAFVIPMEYNFLTFEVSSIARLCEFRAISQS